MLLLRSLAFEAVFYLLMGVMGLALAPAALVSRRATAAIMRAYCRIVLALLARLCGLRTAVRGTVPSGDVLVVAKHQSFLDILILMAHLPRPRFVMKAELRRLPVFGFYAMRLGCIPVDRAQGARALGALRRAVADGAGGQVVIYPQGTRVAPGARAPWKPGAALLQAELGLPAIPVATNAGLFWGRASVLRRPGLAVVEFLDPVPPGLPARAFLRDIAARIEAASDRLASGE